MNENKTEEIKNKIKFIEINADNNKINTTGGNVEENKTDKAISYDDAKKYWSTVSSTVNGMLGGYGQLTTSDIRGSVSFIQLLFKKNPAPGKTQALDCGAGIGRVTKNLLIKFFDKVDIVEQDSKFAEVAEETLRPSEHLGTVYNVGLQDFDPDEQKYDIIWAQWVLGHLKDQDLVDFYKRCRKGLKKNGVIVIKENVTSSNAVEIDEIDSSVTRPLKLMKKFIADAGYRIVRETKQHEMPKGMYAVYMIAMKPI